MVRKMTATEAKARILGLLDEVCAGSEIDITKHRRTVARLVPASGSHALKAKSKGVTCTARTDDGLFTTGLEWTVE